MKKQKKIEMIVGAAVAAEDAWVSEVIFIDFFRDVCVLRVCPKQIR